MNTFSRVHDDDDDDFISITNMIYVVKKRC